MKINKDLFIKNMNTTITWVFIKNPKNGGIPE